MHKPESILENETHKFLQDFETQTDHLIPARRPDLELIHTQKKACRTVDFTAPADHRVKNTRKEKERLAIKPCRRTKKNMDNEGDGDPNCNCYALNDL